jgi:hypothetical protein
MSNSEKGGSSILVDIVQLIIYFGYFFILSWGFYSAMALAGLIIKLNFLMIGLTAFLMGIAYGFATLEQK